MTRVGWIDASSGISGDMLLGAYVDAGAPLHLVQSHIDRLALPERVTLRTENVVRGGLGAIRIHVGADEPSGHRRLPDILALLSPLDDEVRVRATKVFRMIAEAEARVHRTGIDDVHFHEIGALDSIADVVGVCAAAGMVEMDQLMCSPIALGGGRATTAHGSIPIPGPAVLELLAGVPVPAHGGPLDHELATPTGVALAITLADGFGPMPMMVLDRVGTGAGAWDPDGHANIARLVIGNTAVAIEYATLLEANVDDMDPRLWPGVISALMAAGAADAWLTPIVMKKGRPAHTISVLSTGGGADDVARILLRHTSTIGLRRTTVEKTPLPREEAAVHVAGAPVRVKIARLGGAIVNVSAEFDDVARVAAATGQPEKEILAEALRQAKELW